MKTYSVIEKKNFHVRWHNEETMLEFWAGLAERLWNWGLPVISGVLIVQVSPWWALLALATGIFQLTLTVKKK